MKILRTMAGVPGQAHSVGCKMLMRDELRSPKISLLESIASANLTPLRCANIHTIMFAIVLFMS